MFRFLVLLLCITESAIGASSYLFAGFKGNGADGVYFAVSDDAYHRELLNAGRPFVAAEKAGELMRDPQLARGPDGEFQMVWTWSWNLPPVVEHASSPDLVNWSGHAMLDVMAKQPGTRNVWAPETYYEKDRNRWLLIWSSTVSKDVANLRDHRIWSVTTPDFRLSAILRYFSIPASPL